MNNNLFYNLFKKSKNDIDCVKKQIDSLKKSKCIIDNCDNNNNIIMHISLRDNIITKIKQDTIFNDKYTILKTFKNDQNKGIFLIKDRYTEKKLICRAKIKSNVSKNEELIIDRLIDYNCSNISNYKNIFEIDNIICIIVEYIKGYTFKDILINNINIDICDLLYKSLISLKSIHDIGIIHCDLKPDNIILTDDFNVKIIDFDLSVIGNYTSDNIFGTENFLSPETYNLGMYTEKSDIWALGIIFYNILTKENSASYTVNLNHSSSNLFRKNEFKHIDFDLESFDNCKITPIIKKMLEYDPDNRPNAMECIKEFEIIFYSNIKCNNKLYT